MKRALLALCLLGALAPLRAADYDSCPSDLDDLRRRADDASTKAEDVSDAEERLRRCRDDDEKSGCDSEAHIAASAALRLRFGTGSRLPAVDPE
jgi:hypothetical protein